MQEFLSGANFEQMAREYNEKYNKASALTSDSEQIAKTLNKNINQEKEKLIQELKSYFENISSLFLFVKTHINRFGVKNFNNWGKFYYTKLQELEKTTQKLQQKFFELVKL